MQKSKVVEKKEKLLLARLPVTLHAKIKKNSKKKGLKMYAYVAEILKKYVK